MKKLLVSFFILSFCISISAQTTHQYHSSISLPSLFNQAIADHAFPGGCIIAGSKNKIFVDQCHGYFTYDKKKKMQTKDLFDLASLTKVVATTSAIMKLYQQHKIHLNDKVVKYLPQFKGPTLEQTRLKAQITIKDLLAHTSGLPPDNNVKTWKGIYSTPVVEFRDHETIYSDLNFLLLGKIVEKVSGMSLAAYTKKTIFKPLGMKNTTFLPNSSYKNRIIPTSLISHKNKIKNDIVDDPLSFVLGGDAGNAGLFSTSEDLAKFCQMMLNNGKYHGKKIFKPSTIALFTKRANILPNSSRALGWDTVYNPKALLPIKDRAPLNFPTKQFYEAPHQFTAGLYIDSNAYGHTGYTGTSIWISPKNNIFVVLLTNRVYPFANDKNTIEKYWRQRINSAVWKNLGFHKKNLLYREPDKLKSSNKFINIV